VQESLPTLDVMAISAWCRCIRGFRYPAAIHLYPYRRRLDLSLSAQVFRHLMRLPLAYFESRRRHSRTSTGTRTDQTVSHRYTVILDSIFASVPGTDVLQCQTGLPCGSAAVCDLTSVNADSTLAE